MFLVDNNVISEARKGKRADPGVVAFWAEEARNDTPIFRACVTIGELRRGVELIRYRGDQQQGELLEQWLEQVLIDYGDRVLSLDGEAAQVWGRLRVPNPQHGIDKQIADIALLHDLTIVTRNIADFAGCGMSLLNPFANG
jgi:predicted nucleic acid-binding protein